MHPTEQNPLGEYFDEGLQARRDGKTRHDNPYSAGSTKRREWNAGFCATVDDEDEGGLKLDPDGDLERHTSD